jgi:hypothetical protein
MVSVSQAVKQVFVPRDFLETIQPSSEWKNLNGKILSRSHSQPVGWEGKEFVREHEPLPRAGKTGAPENETRSADWQTSFRVG